MQSIDQDSSKEQRVKTKGRFSEAAAVSAVEMMQKDKAWQDKANPQFVKYQQ